MFHNRNYTNGQALGGGWVASRAGVGAPSGFWIQIPLPFLRPAIPNPCRYYKQANGRDYMHTVETTDLREIATRVRRQTANRDVLALCDAVLAGAHVARAERVSEAPKPVAGCPVCEARRMAKTAAQRKWRSKGKVDG